MKKHFLVFAIFLLIFANLVFASEEVKIVAFDSLADDRFGHSVAINDEYAIVSSIFDDDRRGSAYLYSRDANGINDSTFLVKLVADDGSSNDRFGSSIAISGDYIVVGAPIYSQTGAAYVFYRNQNGADSWGQMVKLTGSNSVAGDNFGSSVHISDSLIIVGSPSDSHSGISSAGSAYIFALFENTWIERDSLFASDAATDDFFGSAVAINGNEAIIGAYGDDDLGGDSGAAYFFNRRDSGWVQYQREVPNQFGPSNFGVSISIDSNNVAIGAPVDNDGGGFVGATYVYTLMDSNWTLQQKIFASDGINGDQFGYSVSIDNDYLLAGAFQSDPSGLSNGGAVYSYLRVGETWNERIKEIADDEMDNDWFGFAVAINGDYSIAGARNADLTGAADAGAAYVYYSITNDPPTANDDSVNTTEDTAIGFTTTVNDSDSNGDPIAISSVIQGLHGLATIQNDSTISYLPNLNYAGVDSFYYVLSDSLGAVDTATVHVVIISVNDLPVAVNDSTTTNEDIAAVIDILINDSDEDGVLLPASVFVTGGPANGGTSIDTTTGAVTYTPVADWNGIETFTYTVEDDSGAVSNTATVTITVISINDVPLAVDDAAATNEDVAVDIDVLANDSDPDGALVPASVTVTGGPANGGTSVNTTTGEVTYTPTADWNGIDSFTYTVEDDSGAVSNTATVTVTVNSINDVPLAVDDGAFTNEDIAVVIDVLANDSDPDGALVPASVNVTGGPANGGTSVNTTTGAVTYTPTAGWNGIDSFTYTVEDDSAAVSNTATVTVTVNSINDVPLAVDDAASTNEDIAVVIDVLANDSDTDGALVPASVTVTSGPANGGTSVNTTTGEVTYTPTADWNGIDSFTYTVEDDSGAVSNTATVTVTVNSINDVPLAVDDGAFTNEDIAVVIDVLANDSDPDGALVPASVNVTGGPANGGTSVNTTTGAVTYTPTAGWNGIDTFTYTVEDDSAAVSNTATVTVTVNSINDVPLAVDDAASTNEDIAVVIDVLANDSDTDGALVPASVTVTSGPANGGTSVNTTTGEVTYTPTADWNGIDSFTYTVEDDSGAVSNTATVTVTVNSINDVPLAVDDAASTNEDIAVVIDMLANDSDPDGALVPASVNVTGGPANGGTSVNTTTGAVTYTPTAGWNGIDTFTYTVDDSAAVSNTATVTIYVGAVNNPPLALNDAAVTNEDVAVAIDVLANDSDPDGVLEPASVTVTGGPTNGGTNVNATNGVVTYTPSADWNGIDTFTYTVQDDSGAVSNSATVTVTVNSINDAPIGADDAVSTNEDLPVVIDVLANDSDTDGALVTASVTVTGGPANGGTSVNTTTGAVTYTPTAGWNGIDSFTYTVEDDSGAVSNTASVTITVGSVNDIPLAADDSASTNEDVVVVIDVLANDFDSDGALVPASVTVTGGPTNGGTSVNTTTGAVTYTPTAGWNGIDTFTYTVEDDSSAVSNAATVTVTVNSVNDAPVILPLPELAFNEDDSLFYPLSNLYNYVTDIDHPDSVLIYILNIGNFVTVSGDSQNITLKAPANWFGLDSLELIISDGELSDTAHVLVTVYPVNDAPTFVNLPDTIQFFGAFDTTLFMNNYVIDNDPGDSLQWTFNSSNDSLDIQFNILTSELTLSGPANLGTAFFSSIVEDDSAATDADTVYVKVNITTQIEMAVGLNIPANYELYQNYPNPFNPSTTIKYALPKVEKVKIAIYDITGKLVEVVFKGQSPAGIHKIKYQASSLTSGIYFLVLNTSDKTLIKKMIFIK